MKIVHSALAASFALLLCQQASGQLLGTASTYGVLAGSTVTNTGPTVISGDLGVWPGTAVTGFPPGILIDGGTMQISNAAAMQAQSDLTTAYNTIAGTAYDIDLTGQDLGGMTLVSGVYHFSSSAFLTGTLTLDAQGNPDAHFWFQIGSTLITASNSSVVVINGGTGCNIFWQVGSSATLGTTTDFTGHILALTSITMNTGATITQGAALARNGAVTLDSNVITTADCDNGGPVIPGPTAFLPFLGGIGSAWFARRRKGSRSAS